jgi:outer membrane protein TolC
MRAALTTLTVLMCLGAATPAAAQTTLPLTLEEAITRGVAHDPRLGEARARDAAAASAVSSSNTLGKPTLTASAGYLRTNHVPPYGVPQPNGELNIIFPDIPNKYRTRAELDVPIYTAGRVDALVASARADQQASAADLTASEQDVRMDVTRAYWGLVMARENIRVLKQALDREDAYVGDVKSRVDAGVLPPNDLLSAQAQRARESVQLIQATNDAAVAQIALGLLIGVGPDAAIEPTTPVDLPIAGAAALTAQQATALAAAGREQRGERLSLAARQAGLMASAGAALAGTKPTVGGVAAIQPARPNDRFVPPTDQWNVSWDLGVNVTWELWDSGRARADAATATAQAEAVSHGIEQFDARLALEVRQALLDVQTSHAALAASAEAVAAATEAHRVVVERFNAGVATSTDVLDAQLALVQAELERTRLSADLRVNEARLLRSVGKL